MSLKTFHIIFVIISLLISIGFGGWSFLEFRQQHDRMMLFLSIGSFVFSGLLLWYGQWFLEKIRSFS